MPATSRPSDDYVGGLHGAVPSIDDATDQFA
jgi:hypothetical protein